MAAEATRDLILTTRQATICCERLFRQLLMEAKTLEQRRLAENGLRHAIGLRQATEKISGAHP